jgi:ADP-ribose pyrophosphatase YjhB (NUDIX family)
VGAIISDDSRRLLLVRRGRPPGEGLWSVPGGRVEPGESDAEAVVREVAEETGLVVAVGPPAGTVERPGPGGVVYEIRDYLAEVVGGVLVPGDDAADARWFDPGELPRLPLTPGLLDALTGWGIIGPPSGSSATG